MWLPTLLEAGCLLGSVNLRACPGVPPDAVFRSLSDTPISLKALGTPFHPRHLESAVSCFPLAVLGGGEGSPWRSPNFFRS